MILNDLNSAVNVALGLAGAWHAFQFWRVERANYSWAWLKLVLAAVGIYWAAFYGTLLALSLLGMPADTSWTGLVFVRPAITFTLGVNTLAAWHRRRYLQNYGR